MWRYVSVAASVCSACPDVHVHVPASAGGWGPCSHDTACVCHAGALLGEVKGRRGAFVAALHALLKHVKAAAHPHTRGQGQGGGSPRGQHGTDTYRVSMGCAQFMMRLGRWGEAARACMEACGFIAHGGDYLHNPSHSSRGVTARPPPTPTPPSTTHKRGSPIL